MEKYTSGVRTCKAQRAFGYIGPSSYDGTPNSEVADRRRHAGLGRVREDRPGTVEPALHTLAVDTRRYEVSTFKYTVAFRPTVQATGA